MSGTMTIVIPTYNESKNVVNMAKAIREAYPEWKVLFMDDNSTDGTIQLIEGLGDPLTRIHVREPEKRGLGASVLEGFSIADTDYAMCMDCDFQHPICALQGLYDQMEGGADLCVGVRNSRMSMGFKRAAGSILVEAFCKIFFRIHGKYTTKDMMSGLFALRCDRFRDEITTHWDEMELRGWKVLMDLMKYNDGDLTIKYSRYDFGTRAEGESHINPKVAIMTFHQLWGFGKFLAKFFCKVYHVDYYEMYPTERKS